MEGFNLLRDQDGRRREVLDQDRPRTEACRVLAAAPATGMQERLESIFRAAPIGIGLLCHRVFLEFNDRFCEMTGYDHAELLGRSSRVLYLTQEDYDLVETAKYAQIAHTGIGTLETRWQRKDGRVIDILLSSSALDRADLSKGVTFTATDITAAREVQARLRESERMLQEAEALAHVGSFRRDLRTGAITWSDETYRIYGYTPGEVSPSADLIWSHIHPEDRARFASVTGLPQGTAQPDPITYRILRTDGRVRILHARPRFECDDSGTPVQLLGVLQDVTDYEHARQALCESENKFKTLADESFDGIAIHDGVRIMEVNRTFCRAWGGEEPQEAVGQNVERFISPASLPTVKENIARGYDRPYEIVAVRKDGTTFPAEIISKPITYRGRQVRIATLRDVTERRQVEEALRTSEERFRGVFQHAPLGIIISSTEGRILAVNPAFARISGYAAHELIGRRMAEHTHPEDLPAVRQKVIGMLRGQQERTEMEKRFLRKDGSAVWTHVTLTTMKDGQGKIEFMVGIIEDISERKRAEDSLRKSEALLREAQTIARLGHYTLDFTVGRFETSEVVDQIFGIGPDAPRDVAAWLKVVHPEERPELEAYLRDMRHGKHQSFDREYRIIRPNDHQIRWVHGLGKLEFNPEGRLTRIVGTVQDITERKRTQENVVAQRRKLRSLASELSLTEERERRRIAAELHDHACQSLALAKMCLQSQLEAARPSKSVLSQAYHALEETLGAIRNLTFDLSSATLYRFGLEAALEELLADRLTRPRPIPYRFTTDHAPKPLTVETSILLFQCVRELLINIIKHADAGNVTLEVAREGDHIQILVADDGVGFDSEAILSSTYRNRSVGLFFVRERLDYAGGTLQVVSRPGGGSRFVLTAPLDQRTESMKENDNGREDSVS